MPALIVTSDVTWRGDGGVTTDAQWASVGGEAERIKLGS